MKILGTTLQELVQQLEQTVVSKIFHKGPTEMSILSSVGPAMWSPLHRKWCGHDALKTPKLPLPSALPLAPAIQKLVLAKDCGLLPALASSMLNVALNIETKPKALQDGKAREMGRLSGRDRGCEWFCESPEMIGVVPGRTNPGHGRSFLYLSGDTLLRPGMQRIGSDDSPAVLAGEMQCGSCRLLHMAQALDRWKAGGCAEDFWSILELADCENRRDTGSASAARERERDEMR